MEIKNEMSGHYTPFERVICVLTAALCLVLFVMILGMAGEQEVDLRSMSSRTPAGVTESAR
jgi:hypothetical protein